jgi:hypothetical protein
MKTIQKLLLVCAIAPLCGIAVGADHDASDKSYTASGQSYRGSKGCSMRNVAGKWLFATSIGRQMLPNFPPDKDITALGTMVIALDGSLSGTFDVTVQDSFFMAGIPYEGSVVINRDCTGTVTFVTGVGSVRTDSIAVVGPNEILGMSQDPFNLWSYQARRVGFYSHWTD